MRQSARSVVGACLIFGAVSVSADRPWQDGTWRDTDRLSSVAGAVVNAGSVVVVNRVYQTFVIETPTHLYVAQQRLRWRWSKPLPMTVNAPMKYSIEKDKVYVIAEDKKEYELEITKKILKTQH